MEILIYTPERVDILMISCSTIGLLYIAECLIVECEWRGLDRYREVFTHRVWRLQLVLYTTLPMMYMEADIDFGEDWPKVFMWLDYQGWYLFWTFCLFTAAMFLIRKHVLRAEPEYIEVKDVFKEWYRRNLHTHSIFRSCRSASSLYPSADGMHGLIQDTFKLIKGNTLKDDGQIPSIVIRYLLYYLCYLKDGGMEGFDGVECAVCDRPLGREAVFTYHSDKLNIKPGVHVYCMLRHNPRVIHDNIIDIINTFDSWIKKGMKNNDIREIFKRELIKKIRR